MKLHAQAAADVNAVTAYGAGYVEINRVRHCGPLILAAQGPVRTWALAAGATVPSLQPNDFEILLALRPEVVLIGTGARQQFLAPRLAAWLAGAGMGHEAMDTAAACRTFNILVAEGRRVVGAFLPPDPISPNGAANE